MNIVLIGMPGCGKSTIGVLLAKALLLDFVDTDLVIQKEYGKGLCAIIDEFGLAEFKSIENSVLANLKLENSVIATGGSAVYGEEAMENLKKDALCVYIKLPPSEIKARIKNITTRGIAMEKGTTIDDLYLERAPLYEKCADITVEGADSSVEENVSKIVEKLEKIKENAFA